MYIVGLENERLLYARRETQDETMDRVGHAPYVRVKITAAVIEAISSLTLLKIQNAWNVGHLCTFYGTPNYTKKQEEDLLKQLPKEAREDLLNRFA